MGPKCWGWYGDSQVVSEYATYLALSKYLPVYAIPHAAPNPCPYHPIAISKNASCCKRNYQTNLFVVAINRHQEVEYQANFWH